MNVEEDEQPLTFKKTNWKMTCIALGREDLMDAWGVIVGPRYAKQIPSRSWWLKEHKNPHGMGYSLAHKKKRRRQSEVASPPSKRRRQNEVESPPSVGGVVGAVGTQSTEQQQQIAHGNETDAHGDALNATDSNVRVQQSEVAMPDVQLQQNDVAMTDVQQQQSEVAVGNAVSVATNVMQQSEVAVGDAQSEQSEVAVSVAETTVVQQSEQNNNNGAQMQTE